MRSIFNIYELMRSIVRKERGIFITPSDAMAYLDAAQLEKFEADFTLYGKDQTLHDSLMPFKVTNQQFTSASDGKVTFPDDYQHFLDDLFTVMGSTINKCTNIKETEKAQALTSQLRPVTTSNPLWESSADGIQLYPQTTQTGFYSYLRRPATPVLAFTQAGRVQTYDAAGSTQLEWQDNFINNIIARALAYWGVYMDEDKMVQFSQLKQSQTDAQ